MDLGEHFAMDYTQILRKCPNKAKQTTFARSNSERNLVMHFYKPHIITEVL